MACAPRPTNRRWTPHFLKTRRAPGVLRSFKSAHSKRTFCPIKDLTTTLDYTYARNKVQTLGAELAVWFNHPPTQTTSWVTGPVASPSNHEEQVKLQDLAMNGHDFATVATLKSTGFNAQFRASDLLRLSFDVHHCVSDSGADSMGSRTRCREGGRAAPRCVVRLRQCAGAARAAAPGSRASRHRLPPCAARDTGRGSPGVGQPSAARDQAALHGRRPVARIDNP
jgi:hypothetical protein